MDEYLEAAYLNSPVQLCHTLGGKIPHWGLALSEDPGATTR
jgi:hypothetical protein